MQERIEKVQRKRFPKYHAHLYQFLYALHLERSLLTVQRFVQPADPQLSLTSTPCLQGKGADWHSECFSRVRTGTLCLAL